MNNVQELLNWLQQMGLSERAVNKLRKEDLNPKVVRNLTQFRKNYDESRKIIYIDFYPTHIISISLPVNKLECYLTIIGLRRSISRLQNHVSGIMSSIGLIESDVYREMIKQFVGRDLILEPVIEEILSRGTPPIAARPSDVKLLVKPFTRKPEYNENESGQINYHDLNLFQNIIQNQSIGEYQPPVEGVPGRDVFDETIPCGEADDMPIQCGHGVMLDEVTNQYIATVAGYLLYDDRRLRIEETYVVEGDVNLNVGHVNFVSDVVVRGDILPDFSVNSGGSVDVIGTVTGASIQTEKDLNMRLGVLGQGKSFLKVAGDVYAKFINESRLESGGTLHLGVEALNSIVCCSGEIKGDHAVVIGGRMVSMNEIQVSVLGSELGLKTHVFLGEDYQNLNQTEEVREAILKLRDRVSVQLRKYGLHIHTWQKDLRDTPEAAQVKKEELPVLLKRLEELRSDLSDLVLLNQEFRLLSSDPPSDRKAECYIEKTIFPGVVFFCTGSIFEVKEKIDGPVLVRGEDLGQGRSKIVIEKTARR